MNNALHSLWLAGFLVLSACSSTVTLKPVSPADTATVAADQGVAAVEVGIADDMPEDREKMLKDMGVPTKLEQALLASFANKGMKKPDGVTLTASIHAYRVSNWGPSRMGAKVTVTDASGNVVEEFERQAATVRGGSTATRTQRLAQELVQKISDET